MDAQSLYNDIAGLMPYHADSDLPFRKRLGNALALYIAAAKRHGVPRRALNDIVYISQRLKDIVANYEKGLHSTAFAQLQNLVQGKKGLAPKINLADTLLDFDP